MDGISERGVDGITAVVLVPPHLVAGLLDARTEARGGLATAESLRSSLRIQQLPLAWYSRQNLPTGLEEY